MSDNRRHRYSFKQFEKMVELHNMQKNRLIISLLLIIFAAAVNVAVCVRPESYDDATVSLNVTLESDSNLSTQVFYADTKDAAGPEFTEDNSVKAAYAAGSGEATLSYAIPVSAVYVRFDPATEAGVTVLIRKITVSYGDTVIDTLSGEQTVTAKDSDPYILLGELDTDAETAAIIPAVHRRTLIRNIAECLAVDLIILLLIIKWYSVVPVPREIWQNRVLTMSLAKNDFKTRFAGSYLGIVWAFVQPVVTILLFWLVFEKAMHAGPQPAANGTTVPYVLWLTAGLVPWFFFQDALNSGTSTFMEYAYLVKKVVFNIGILPVVKVISNLFVHLAFVAFMFVMYLALGQPVTVHAVQILYYSVAMICYVTALVYVTSALCVFFRDLSQIIGIFMQVFMWSTPIMWNLDSMSVSAPVGLILRLNPMFYIVQGYRDAMINRIWFTQRLDITVYFWTLTVLLFILGTTIYRKLKVHFADVL